MNNFLFTDSFRLSHIWLLSHASCNHCYLNWLEKQIGKQQQDQFVDIPRLTILDRRTMHHHSDYQRGSSKIPSSCATTFWPLQWLLVILHIVENKYITNQQWLLYLSHTTYNSMRNAETKFRRKEKHTNQAITVEDQMKNRRPTCSCSLQIILPTLINHTRQYK